jgi:hypothetical protein
MRKLLPVFVTVVVLLLPRPAHAWGFDAHRFVMAHAIALLPPELRPFFEKNRAEVVERAIDPDTWITAGWEEERPRHFVDLDLPEFGPYPFLGLPRDYTAAVAKFGENRMRQVGTLPWRTEEMFGALRRGFDAYARGDSYAPHDVVVFSAWLTHYTSDGCVPLHGAANYNGQLTNQTGVHARWESDMFERYRDQLAVSPQAIPPVRDPRGFVFDLLLEDTKLVPALLKSDLDAIGNRDVYDDAYYAAFFAANKPVMEQRLNRAIAASAAMMTGAWEAAGKPEVSLNRTPRPQRRRR